MASWLIEWKSDTETQWLKEAPSQPLQQSLKDLERAYKNFFSRNVPLFLDSRNAVKMTLSLSAGREASINPIVVYHCQSWDGCATATVVKSSEKCETSRSVSHAVNGTSAFGLSMKRQNHNLNQPQ